MRTIRCIKRCISSALALLLCAGLGCSPVKPDAGNAQNAVAENAPAQIIEITTAENGDVAAAPENAPQATAPEGELSVLFINVGKADAALVSFGGHNVLIDTGTKESAPRLIGALACMGVTALDAVCLTHTHSDHVGGLPALNGAIPIARLYAAEISENKKNGENKITELAEECALPLTRLTAGDTVPLFDGAVCTVLGPIVQNAEDDNDNSLVLRLSANGQTLLFTGDMQFAEEETLLSRGVDLSADILKVGNHGNPDATSEAFAQAVSPSLAVISTDTREDTDSANPRVRAALSGAEIRVTEKTDLGVLLTVKPDGALAVTEPSRPASAARISIVSVDKDTQTLTLHNEGDALDIGGYLLLSERGGELFRFPAGSVLAAGQTVTIAAEGGKGDFLFAGESKPWNQKKYDAAVLYDRFGRELARY